MFQNYMQCQTVIIYDINRKRQFYFCPPTRLPDFVATEISKVSKVLWPLLMHDCTHSKVNRPEAATIPVQQKKATVKNFARFTGKKSASQYLFNKSSNTDVFL